VRSSRRKFLTRLTSATGMGTLAQPEASWPAGSGPSRRSSWPPAQGSASTCPSGSPGASPRSPSSSRKTTRKHRSVSGSSTSGGSGTSRPSSAASSVRRASSSTWPTLTPRGPSRPGAWAAAGGPWSCPSSRERTPARARPVISDEGTVMLDQPIGASGYVRADLDDKPAFEIFNVPASRGPMAALTTPLFLVHAPQPAEDEPSNARPTTRKEQ
jgi:hypothetical protein